MEVRYAEERAGKAWDHGQVAGVSFCFSFARERARRSRARAREAGAMKRLVVIQVSGSWQVPFPTRQVEFSFCGAKSGSGLRRKPFPWKWG